MSANNERADRSDMVVQLAPFALIRVAAVPLRRLESMATPETSGLVASAVAADSALESLRPLVEQHLYTLVPSLSDKELRAAAIQLGRDAHNARLPQVDSGNLVNILERSPARARDDIRAWLQTRQHIAELTELGQSTLEDETHSKLRPALWSAIDDHCLSQGLALASPVLRHLLDIERNRRAPKLNPTKREVALLGYLLRAVCKTSPFSTFMDIGILPVDRDREDDFPSLATARRVTSLRLNRGTLARFYNASVRALALKDNIQFRPNPTIRKDTHQGIVALVGEQVALLGRPWRQERVARFRFHQDFTKILVSLPASFPICWLLEQLERVGLTSERARHFAEKLIERELILPPAAIDAFVVDTLGEVRDSLCTSHAPEAQTILSSIAALESSADAARHGGWEQRIEVDRVLRATERGTLDHFRFGSHEAYRTMFFEESRLDGLTGGVGRRLHELICEVGGFLRDQVALRPEYVRLRAAFQTQYGVSGICTDPVRFLSEQVGSLVDITEWGGGARPFLKAGPNVPAKDGARIGLTAFLQIPANPRGDDDFIVVNRVYEGVGWLSARHSTGSGSESTELRDRMWAWLEHTYAPAEPIDVPVSGHCNDLQAHPRLTRRVLAWPGEPIRSDRADVLPVGNCALRLDAATGLLELLDEEGLVIAPVYLGSVLPVPSWGPIFGLTVLARPMQLLRPLAASPVAQDSHVTFYPRRTHGRVVLTRASWSVRSTYLLDKWLSADGFRQLVDVAEFCEANGIPRVFFARAQRWIDPLADDSPINARKPTFIDTSNLFCLDLFARLAHDAETIVLTEVLPTHEQAWQMGKEDRHVTELQVEMCISATSGR